MAGSASCSPSQDLLMYDVTSTYFEGQGADNPLAKRGYSRDHRPDCKQVCIGLVVTEQGLPLGYEAFAGNRHDSTTLKTIVDTMERKYGHGPTDLGAGPRHRQRSESRDAAAARRALHRRHPEGDAAKIRAASVGTGLDRGAAGRRRQTRGRRQHQEIFVFAQSRSARKRASDAREVRQAHEEPSKRCRNRSRRAA